MRPFSRRSGFVSSAFTELMIFFAMAGVVAAIFVPKFLRLRNAGKTHECASRLDARAAQPDEECIRKAKLQLSEEKAREAQEKYSVALNAAELAVKEADDRETKQIKEIIERIRCDSRIPDTCPISGVRFVIDGSGEGARFCCPTPQRHEKVEELCRASDGPVLAIAHPAPSRIALVLTGVVAGASSLVLALVGVVYVVVAIANAFHK